MRKRCAMTLRASENVFVSKDGQHPLRATKAKEDNDTPVQSQPSSNAGTRNEDGSERTSEGHKDP
ncbi:MAG: hypothetical protein GX663_06545 [Clostridiales bacterium]|nr:hypothetical protein [Clostridiales bacterium]